MAEVCTAAVGDWNAAPVSELVIVREVAVGRKRLSLDTAVQGQSALGRLQVFLVFRSVLGAMSMGGCRRK